MTVVLMLVLAPAGAVHAITMANATLSSPDSIIGERQSGAPALGYYPDAAVSILGTSGSGGERTDRNVVLGYTLPTLPAGSTIESVKFFFEITGARDSTGGGNLPDLDVYLLDTANPDVTGTTFFFHGASDPNLSVAEIDSTSVTISGTAQVNFADDAEDREFDLTGDALDLFKSFYGGDGTPNQAEAFIRFNMDEDPSLSTLRRYHIDLATDESRIEIAFTVIPEPATGSLLGIVGLAYLAHCRRRRR